MKSLNYSEQQIVSKMLALGLRGGQKNHNFVRFSYSLLSKKINNWIKNVLR